MKKRVRFAIIIYLISFVCLFGMSYTPQKIKKPIYNKEDVVLQIGLNDVTETNSVEYDSMGNYTISGEDPYIVYSCNEEKVNVVVLKIAPLNRSCVVNLYIDHGQGYSEGEKYFGIIMSGDEYAFFDVNLTDVTGMRFDIDENVTIQQITVHKDIPKFEVIKYPLQWPLILMSFILSVIFGCVAFFIHGKVDVLGGIGTWFLNNKQDITMALRGLVFVLLLAALIEVFVSRFVLNMFSMGISFNGYRYIFWVGVMLTIGYGYLMKNQVSEKLETVILGFILIVGTTFILTQPFGHSGWDIDSHYRMAQNSSYLGRAYITYADNSFFTCAYESLVKPTGVMNRGNIEYMNNAYQYVMDIKDTSISLPHLPSAIFMAVSRLFGGSFYRNFLAGEFANLLIYAILVYYSIKKLKSGKMILAVFALFPTNFVLACNYSYDYWVTGFAMLGTAYFIGECQDRDNYITVKNTVVMCVAFALACVPKQIYLPLMLLPFLMPKSKIKNKKLYYTICVGLVALLFASLLLRTATETSVGGDIRGGDDVSVTGQLDYIFHNKRAFLKTFITHILAYLSFGNMHNMITSYANMGTTTWGATIMMILLMFVAITDKNEKDKYSSGWLIKTYSVLMFIGTAMLVSLAFYLVFTPVGAEFVAGCQARYLFPVLIPFLLVVGPHTTRTEMNTKLYRWGILGATVFITLVDNFLYTIIKMC